MNIKRLIIPDIHHGHRVVERIIAVEQPCQIILLGDYFDGKLEFPDDLESVGAAARWLRRSLEDPARIHLLGNHDVQYRWPGRHTRAVSTLEQERVRLVQSILTPEHWQRFQWHHVADGWLFTHAGLSAFHLPKRLKTPRGVINFLEREEAQAETALMAGKSHWLFAAGWSRGGLAPAGGITWCDFVREFTPVPFLRQIFGHTPGCTPRRSGDNLCLDTGLEHYAVLMGGRVEIRTTSAALSKHARRQLRPESAT